jgi:hypothetical protein
VYQINATAVAAKAGKATTICLSVSLALLFPRPAGADAVTDWNANAGNQHSPRASHRVTTHSTSPVSTR